LILSRAQRTVNGKECVVLRVSSDLVADVTMPSGRIFPLAVLERAVKEFNDEHCAEGNALGTVLVKDEVPHTVINISHITHFVDKLEIDDAGRVVATVTVINFHGEFPTEGAVRATCLETFNDDFTKAVLVGSGSTDEKTDTVKKDYFIHRVDIRIMKRRTDFPKRAYDLISDKLPEMIAHDFADVQPMADSVMKAVLEMEECIVTDEMRQKYVLDLEKRYPVPDDGAEFVNSDKLVCLGLPTEVSMVFGELLREKPVSRGLCLYCSPKWTWPALCGRAGVLVVEDGMVIAAHTTCMS